MSSVLSDLKSRYLTFSIREQIQRDDEYQVFITYRRYFPKLYRLNTLIQKVGILFFLIISFLLLIDVSFGLTPVLDSLIIVGFFSIAYILFINSDQLKLQQIIRDDHWKFETTYYLHKAAEEDEKTPTFVLDQPIDFKRDSYTNTSRSEFQIYHFENTFPKKDVGIFLRLGDNKLTIPETPKDENAVGHYIPRDLEIYHATPNQYQVVEEWYSWFNLEQTFNLVIFIIGLGAVFALVYLGLENDKEIYLWIGLVVFLGTMALLLRSWLVSLFGFLR